MQEKAKENKLNEWLTKHQKVLTLLGVLVVLSLIIIPFIFRNFDIFYDDINFHCSRIKGIADALLGGQFPVKYYPDAYSGNGYFSPIFYGDIFLYIPAIFTICGMSVKVAYYIFIALIVISLILSMYYVSKKMLRSSIYAVIASLVFITSKYVFVDIFYRGAIGEIIALIFLIWLFYGIYNMLYEDYSKPYILSIAMLGMIFSHMTTLILSCILLMIVVLCNVKKLFRDKSFWLKSIFAILIFLFCSSYYISSFLEMYVTDIFCVSKPWVYPSQRALSIVALLFTDIYSVGIFAFIPFVLRFFVKKDIDNKRDIKLLNVLLIVSGILIYMTTKYFPWKLLDNIFAFVQFPWRLNVFIEIMLSISFVIELKYFKWNNNIVKIILVLLVLCICCISNNFILRNKGFDYNSSSLTGCVEWVPIKADTEYLNDTTLYDESGNEVEYIREEHALDMSFEASGDNDYYISPFIFYKGYSAYIIDENGDSIELEVCQSENGKIKVKTNGLQGLVRVYYKGTTIQFVSLIANSIGTVLSIGAVAFYEVKRKKQYKEV